jgi:exodeoxyribonuclease VII large subunit
MATLDYDLADEGLELGRPLSISEITAQIKEILETGLEPCWIIGELSQYTHHSSGHRYFTLKDESTQLSCVMFKWQGRNLSFEPESGMQIMAYGHTSIYERGGRYQFYVSYLQPAGVGEMALAFEQLKNRLEEEGLFDVDRKRPLPPFPRRVGMVTSATGAAVRDMIQVLGRRAPGIQLILAPARVQGPGAAEEIVAGIKDLNAHAEVDILIVGRGGGAPEDLWPFNEEIVARAIYQSAKPVISAVGHEIDYTIADYVADYRAPTPSAAAEIVAQDNEVLRRQVSQATHRLRQAIQGKLDHCAQTLESYNAQRLGQRLEDRLAQTSQYADERRQALATALDWYMRAHQQNLANNLVRLQALSPLANLARGFVRCSRDDNKQPVRSPQDLTIGDRIELRFATGHAVCRVEEISHE